MNQLNKILTVLLVGQVLAVMGLYMGETSSSSTKQVVQILPELDTDKVTELVIEGKPAQSDSDPKQNVVRLKKVNGTWGVSDADQYPADKSKIEELLGKLAKMKSRTPVVESAKHHKKLEISEETFQRRITVTQGEKKTTLLLGSSPSFKNAHVRLDGQDIVYLVNGFGSTDANDRTWAWVDRKFQDIPDSEVWAINLTNQKGSFLLEKDPASSQWAAVGIEGELDSSTVNNIVSKARSLNLESPVSKGEKPEHGFGAPLATVQLTTGTSTITGAPPKTTETVTLTVGKKLEEDNQYFVKTSKNEYVVRVAGWSIQPLLEKGKEDLLKKEE